jgi:SM-20-related protein
MMLAERDMESQTLSLDLEGIRPGPIVPQQELSVGTRKLLVFDDIFTDSFIESFGVFILRQDYQPRPSFDNELSAAMATEVVQSLPALPDVANALVAHHHAEMTPAPGDQTLSHAYMAAMRFGDSSLLHHDVPCHDCVTFLYYANLHWTGHWGGETIFYDDDLMAVAAVSPRPGRLLLFNASIYHRAGVPMRLCPTFRYTFSMFYRCAKMLKS